jgi:hypothetical protein
VAAKWGKTNMVSLLLEKGANIESKTRDGLTALHCAARSGHEQVVDMMLERGAPISSKTKVRSGVFPGFFCHFAYITKETVFLYSLLISVTQMFLRILNFKLLKELFSFHANGLQLYPN